MRLAQTQVWPPLRNFETSAPSTARSRSASSKTMKGALPPSSRLSRFHAAGRAAHQQRADACRAGEGDLANGLVRHDLVADLCGHAGDDVDDAGRDARPFGKHAERQRRIGRELGRLDHHGAAGGQRRRDLAGDHRIGKIPRRDDAAHAHRLLQHDDAPVLRRRGDGVAVDAARFLGEPFDEGRAIADFAFGLVQRLALFRRQDQREIIQMRQHQAVPGFQQGSTLGVGLLLPRPVRGSRCLYGRTGLWTSHVRYGADGSLRRWIDDIDGLAGAGSDPPSADQAGFAEEVFVFQVFHWKRPCNQVSAATTRR